MGEPNDVATMTNNNIAQTNGEASPKNGLDSHPLQAIPPLDLKSIEWPFEVDELYKIGLQFFKSNVEHRGKGLNNHVLIFTQIMKVKPSIRPTISETRWLPYHCKSNTAIVNQTRDDHWGRWILLAMTDGEL